MRFIKIMINLACHGVSIFRLDAIAYLWKESGTKCINLKQTHEIIKLLRIICNSLQNSPYLITETNLPEKENLSYFGKKNDEANWIYNFTLPPLLIHAFLFEDSSKLNQWIKKLPSTNLKNNYFNFIAFQLDFEANSFFHSLILIPLQSYHEGYQENLVLL